MNFIFLRQRNVNLTAEPYSKYEGTGEVEGPPDDKFISQFPYKSCQRSNASKKAMGHCWPYNKPPPSAPKRRVSLKRQKYAGKLK